jgi:hypothetical protein
LGTVNGLAWDLNGDAGKVEAPSAVVNGPDLLLLMDMEIMGQWPGHGPSVLISGAAGLVWW